MDLRNNADFQMFVQAIGRYAEECNVLLVDNEKVDLARLQGRTQAVTRILRAIAGASKQVQ
jgi:hypothetical protein